MCMCVCSDTEGHLGSVQGVLGYPGTLKSGNPVLRLLCESQGPLGKGKRKEIGTLCEDGLEIMQSWEACARPESLESQMEEFLTRWKAIIHQPH